MQTAAETIERVKQAPPHGGRVAANMAIAAKLADYADMLDQQGADGFRARAYRHAADVVATLERPVADILVESGRDGLIALPGIGKTIAGAIAEMAATGRWSQLERLRGELVPEALFRTLPGIGPMLAHQLAEEAGLETLEDLENALHFGRLGVKGFGARRRAMMAATLAERLGRPPPAMLLERRPHVSRQGSGRPIALDRAQALQPRGQGLAAGDACAPRRLAFHRAFLQYEACPPARQDTRLGGDLFPPRRPAGGALHGGHRSARPSRRTARGARPRRRIEAGDHNTMTRISNQSFGEEPELAITPEKACFIIMKAREFDAKEEDSDPDSGSNASDDNDLDVLEDTPDDPSLEELKSLISQLTIDEQIDLVALSWLGRDEYPDDWSEVRAQAAEAHNRHTADYLLGDPLLADHLAEGMSMLGLDCAEYEMDHL